MFECLKKVFKRKPPEYFTCELKTDVAFPVKYHLGKYGGDEYDSDVFINSIEFECDKTPTCLRRHYVYVSVSVVNRAVTGGYVFDPPARTLGEGLTPLVKQLLLLKNATCGYFVQFLKVNNVGKFVFLVAEYGPPVDF